MQKTKTHIHTQLEQVRMLQKISGYSKQYYPINNSYDSKTR